MRPACIPLLVLMAAMPALAVDRPVDSRQLESLHGTQIYMLNANEGVPSEIWAMGDYLRAEITTGDRTVITIQRLDTLYTYEKGSRFGTKQHLEAGVSSMGFIRQIDGEQYDQYRWTSQSEPELMVLAYLSPKNSLPRAWYYTTKTGEKKAELHRLIWPPDGVAFTEGSPSDPRKRTGGRELRPR